MTTEELRALIESLAQFAREDSKSLHATIGQLVEHSQKHDEQIDRLTRIAADCLDSIKRIFSIIRGSSRAERKRVQESKP